MAQRPPGSREEDAWLSDAQLARCAPAEADPFQSPVPTRMVSNGEYMPHPQTEQQKHVEVRIKELADSAAKKLGISRRQFLAGTGGMAAAFLAMNEVFGKRFFNVSPIDMFESAAYAETGPPQDLFVFDDQTHIVRTSINSPNALRALAQGPGPASSAAGFTANPFNGRSGNPAGVDELGSPWTPWNPAELFPDSPPNPGPPTLEDGEFHMDKYIRRFFLESQVSVSIISNANIAVVSDPSLPAPRPAKNISESLVSEILTGSQSGAIRDFVNQIAGSQRMLAHAQIYPGIGNLQDPFFGDYTQWQIDNFHPDSWKGYNIAAAAKVDTDPNSLMTRWRLDDEVVAYPIYEVIARNKQELKNHPGFFNLCIHKGLSPNPPDDPEHGNPADIGKAAQDWPHLNFLIYHACIRPSFWMLAALEQIQSGPLRTDAKGHGVPDITWTTEFAQIAGGLATRGANRLKNVYAEIGTTFASTVVTFPTVCAHILGQLLYYMKDDHILFGSDSLWYGGPQWQIEALWRFQIPQELQDKCDYPQLTEKSRRRILGLNSAVLYGLKGAQQKPRGYGAVPPNYASLVPDSLRNLLTGVGYPTPVTPASLIPDDNFSKLRRRFVEVGGGRDSSRHGWIRTRV
jgi:predicted TIM-barrel fold metal-dependent hydrolase